MKLPATLLALSLLWAGQTLHASNFELTESAVTTSFETFKRMILVKARVDNREGYFVLDTGADDLVLNKKHFTEYKPSFINRRKFKDVNGQLQQVEYLPVGSFDWAGLQRFDFYARQLDLAIVEEVLEVELLGLIGYEVFRDLELTIDYPQRTITLAELDYWGRRVSSTTDPAPTYTFDFTLSEHIPTLKADFDGKAVAKFGLDSGSTINLLDQKWKKPLEKAAHRTNEINFVGANASRRRQYYYTVDQLNIQDQFGIRYWKAAVGDLDHFETTDIFLDGILGINFFEIGKVTINYHKKQIGVWPAINGLEWRYVNLH